MPDFKKAGRDAIAKMSAPERRALDSIGVDFAAGQPHQGANNMPAIASVDAGEPNRIEVEDPDKFSKNAHQTVAHEGMHLWQNNLPPTMAAKIPPDDPHNPYAFSLQGLRDLRAKGGNILSLSREVQGTIAQYAAVNPGNKEVQSTIQPYLQDMNKIPLSTIMPTAPGSKTINVDPRPPQAPPMTYNATQTFQKGDPPPGDDDLPAGWTKSNTAETGAGDLPPGWSKTKLPMPKPGNGLNRSGQIDEGPAEDPDAYEMPRMSTELAKEFVPALGQFGMGALKGLASTGQGLLSMAAPKGSFFNSDSVDTIPSNTAQSIGKGVEQVGEFLVPGLGEEAATADLGKIAPLGRMAYNGLTSGVINKMQGGGFGTGAITGAGGELMGAGLRKIAPMLAETAMGVQGLDRAYGRTPGEAVLSDTRGFKPSTVRMSGQQTFDRLMPQLEGIARSSQNPADLAPVLQTLDGKMAAAGRENSPSTVNDLQTIRDHFTNAKTPGAAPYVVPPGTTQTSAEGALNLKRGLSKEFINRWTPEKGTDLEKAARRAYGQAAEAFHMAAPEARELDERMSSLAPIIDRAGMASRRPGVVQGALNRFATPTGALAPVLGGAYAGSHAFGLPGALAGAAAGAVVPHIFASPTVQMFGARTLASPALQRGLLPLMNGGALQLDRPPARSQAPAEQQQETPSLHLQRRPLKQ